MKRNKRTRTPARCSARPFASRAALLIGAATLLASFGPSPYVAYAKGQANSPIVKSGSSGGSAADASAAIAPHWEPLPAPRPGAPNVLIVLTDDVGFGASSTFGGPVPTPNLDRLAAHGVRFTNFNTTAMCSPTRAALLTGRNHHDVGFGAITEMQAGYPGYNNELPANSRTFVEAMKRAGYATAMFGKHHLSPDWMRGLSGPHGQWPTKLGFDYYFGFLAADSDQWHPTLIRGTELVDTDRREARLVDEDLADDAIRWLHQAKADYPDRPFLTYYATGSTHAPHQAPKAWIEKFRGKFDGGWDRLRAETVSRQKAAGIVARSAAVSSRPVELPAWGTLSAEDRRLYARYMEVFAAQLAFQDAQFGRIVDELDRMGELDNTVIVFIEGDNGASAEGGPIGSLSEMRKLFQAEARFTPEEKRDLDRLGGPDSYQIYQAGWAWAMNAPFPLFKQDASHLGGTRNGMVVSWPRGIAAPGRTVDRFQHVIDIAPTILELAGIKPPAALDGVEQTPMAGTSLADALRNPAPPTPPRTQYFEMAGNRALFQDGWWASTVPGRMPWQAFSDKKAADFQWQLFDLRTDPGQTRDLAAKYPERLAAMKIEWDRQAKAHQVYPMRANADVEEIRAGSRPLPTRNEYVFWGGGVHLPWTAQPDLQRGSFTVEANIMLADAQQGEGVVMATGSAMGGWSLKFEDGVPVVYSSATEAAADRFRIAADRRIGPGRHRLELHFLADDAKLGSGGVAMVKVDGETIAEGRIDRRSIRPIGVNEMFDVGMDTGVSVDPGATGWQRFKGLIEKLTVRVGQ